ncbi:J domain-containing protein [Natrialbaceae archaeon A-CW3]
MTDDIDFYDLLGVSADASQDDIKQAFREQVRVYHPDLNDDDRAQAQFTALKKAYDILGDPVERQAYDRLGHEDYVAKRTSGLPSPDVWKRSTDSSSGDDAAEQTSTGGATTAGTGATATGSSSTSSSGTSTSTSSGSSNTGSSTSRTTTGATSSSARAETGGSATGAAGARAAGTGTGTSTGSAGTSGTSHRGRSSATTAGQATANTAHSAGDYGQSGRFGNNALVRWWRNQNFAWPLIWTAILTYLAGLAHFGLENQSGLTDVSRELQTIGADPVAIWALLSESRHGIASATGFVSGVEFVNPPLEPLEWYGVLAGVIVAALLVVLAARVAWRANTWGPVSIDETIVVAIALTAVTLVLGGPLLAGAVLMPLFFGVVVHRTHQLPGWSPSYLYVVCVSAPLVGFGLAAAGYGSLPADLALFVVLPLLGAIGLPMQVSMRTHFRR